MYAAAPVPASRLRGGSPLGANERVLSSLCTSRGVSRPILRLFLARTRGQFAAETKCAGYLGQSETKISWRAFRGLLFLLQSSEQ